MAASGDRELKRVEKVYSFWGKFPYLYRMQDTITFLGKAGTIRKNAVKKLGLRKGDRVLEVACGSGRNFSYLAEAVGKKGFVLGFDYSREMLNAAKELCRQNRWDNIKLVQGDASQLKIDENGFNGVISVLGISAIPGWEKAIRRCHEVLRYGGRMVVCDARLFGGFLRFLNPAVLLVYSKFAAWDPSKNIPKQMKKVFGNVRAESYNLGTFFIAVSSKKNTAKKAKN
ncbi:methyltransferase domain-containing protein [Candidatus Woesearchaeota archaeon]|nr:methyltransferase domain-containing protein [Candidatus Woesearchaeota archaeon]